MFYALQADQPSSLYLKASTAEASGSCCWWWDGICWLRTLWSVQCFRIASMYASFCVSLPVPICLRIVPLLLTLAAFILPRHADIFTFAFFYSVLFVYLPAFSYRCTVRGLRLFLLKLPVASVTFALSLSMLSCWQLPSLFVPLMLPVTLFLSLSCCSFPSWSWNLY